MTLRGAAACQLQICIAWYFLHEERWESFVLSNLKNKLVSEGSVRERMGLHPASDRFETLLHPFLTLPSYVGDVNAIPLLTACSSQSAVPAAA